jgi:hypothetical protein
MGGDIVPAAEESETQKPSDKGGEIKAEESAEAENVSGLPANWIEVEDSQTGQKYYYNCVTQETSWGRPGEEDPDGTIEPQALVQEVLSPEIDEGLNNGEEGAGKEVQEVADEVNTAVAESDAPKLRQLPSGWSEGVDPQSNEVYYYNSVTGETS